MKLFLYRIIKISKRKMKRVLEFMFANNSKTLFCLVMRKYKIVDKEENLRVIGLLDFFFLRTTYK